MQHVILDCIESDRKGKASSEKLIEGYHSLLESIETMVHTNSFMIMNINRCIDYTKASNGVHLVPKLETVCLHDAIISPIKIMNNQQTRVKIITNIIDQNIAKNIITDNQWLQENILCLLSNAVKYTIGESVQLSLSLIDQNIEEGTMNNDDEIRTSMKLNSTDLIGDFNMHCIDIENGDIKKQIDLLVCTQHILIEIEDFGKGLSKEAKNKLFQPFNQDIHQSGGSSTGLGLFSLARRIDALEGKYGVLNRKDNQNGCRFWFSIPYQPDRNIVSLLPDRNIVEEEKITSTTPMVESKNNISLDVPSKLVPPILPQAINLRILVVDDSISILKVTTLMLKRLGCIVDNALNGQESLEMTIKQFDNNIPYDVVLTDIQMPIMDGFEYTRLLRIIENKYNENNQILRHQLIIGVSANSDDRTAATAEEVGIDAFLSKPFSTKSFLDLVDKSFSTKIISN